MNDFGLKFLAKEKENKRIQNGTYVRSSLILEKGISIVLDAVPCTRRKTGHSFQPNAEPVANRNIECPQEIHKHKWRPHANSGKCEYYGDFCQST